MREVQDIDAGVVDANSIEATVWLAFLPSSPVVQLSHIGSDLASPSRLNWCLLNVIPHHTSLLRLIRCQALRICCIS
jgi:hypothetical protein